MKFFTVMMAIILTACTSFQDETGQIKGSVTYRERIALLAGAQLEVQLVDISIADAPAKVIAQQRILTDTQVPISFVLNYPKSEIKEGMTYSVSARITNSGQLLFISDRVMPVLTRGRGSQAHLILVKVRP